MADKTVRTLKWKKIQEQVLIDMSSAAEKKTIKDKINLEIYQEKCDRLKGMKISEKKHRSERYSQRFTREKRMK